MSASKDNIQVTGSILLIILFLLTGCHPRSYLLEPKLSYTPPRPQFVKLPSAFEALSATELQTEWGRELKIGISFATEFDFYRAITSLKRSLFLMPENETERRMQAEYYIVECYFLAHKYCEAVETFECGTLRLARSSFPAFRELLIILYESYQKTEQCEKADAIFSLMEKGDPETTRDLKIFTSLDSGDLSYLFEASQSHPQAEDLNQTVTRYCQCAKSVRTAQFLNAVLPGAGYYYVGQRKSALTSLVLNTSFIAATYYFFDKGNWGAGLFTASLEFGWYFGGINGAGLAAKEYNEWLYEKMNKDLMIRRSLFPVLMLGTSF